VATRDSGLTKPVKAKKIIHTEEQADDDFTTVGKGGKAMQFTAEGIFKNLQVIQEARGKKVCHNIHLQSLADFLR